MITGPNVPEAGSPAWSPDYLAVMNERRKALQDELVQIMPSGGTFVWEVGSGHGHFLAAYAAAHPDRLCIGVDIASERIERALRKRDRARLGNLHFLRADARFFLQCVSARMLISELFVLFPDPWPKARHHKHRILQQDFLAAAAATALPECRLHFRTDFRPYFDDACRAIRDSAQWQLMPATTPWPFEYTTVFQHRATRHDSLIACRQSAAVPVD
jgi:tRNA (guanine-N7-)-methyltransferase